MWLGRRIACAVDVTPTGCWEWRLTRTRLGYGRVRWTGVDEYHAHRLAYEVFVGPIPEGLTLDHLCRNRACVNPGHLEPVSQRENVLRGAAPASRNAVKTSCDHGHELVGGNVYLRRSPRNPELVWRQCKECNRIRQANFQAARRAAS